MSPRHDVAFGPALLALTSAVGITGPDPESRTTWIHVAPFGEWNGHSAGKFSLTNDHFTAVCAQVRAKQTPVSLDYEHASIRANGEPTPAAGYVLTTEVRADGLWALCEFTPRAAEMIKGGEYRFCSGVFDFAAKDQASGAELLCALDTIALTNRPFIDGQHPIALSRRVPLTAGASMKIQIADLLKILKSVDTGEGLTADQITGALSLLASGKDAPEPPKAADKAEASKPADAVVALTEPAPAVALGDMPPPAAPVAAADPLPAAPLEGDADNDAAVDDFDSKLMADLGISDPDAYAQLLMANYDAIKALLVGGDASSVAMSRDLAIKGLTSQLEQVTKERNTLQSQANAAQAAACAAEVDALIRRAPALAAQRESWIALARKSLVEFRNVATAFPASAPLTAPHAVALVKPTDITPPSVISDDHPLMAETRLSLSRSGVKPETMARFLEQTRKRLESAG